MEIHFGLHEHSRVKLGGSYVSNLDLSPLSSTIQRLEVNRNELWKDSLLFIYFLQNLSRHDHCKLEILKLGQLIKHCFLNVALSMDEGVG